MVPIKIPMLLENEKLRMQRAFSKPPAEETVGQFILKQEDAIIKLL